MIVSCQETRSFDHYFGYAPFIGSYGVPSIRFWYPMLTVLIIVATWVTWIISQSSSASLITLFVAVVAAWALTLGRNRLSRSA